MDKEYTQPYTGWIIEIFQGKLSWKFQTKDGEQSGLEKIYEDGHLIQINENEYNMQNGVLKEYDEDGNLTYIRIVWNNGSLKTLHLNNNEIKEKNLLPKQLPEKIIYLFSLSNEELINYEFKTNNPNLDFK